MRLPRFSLSSAFAVWTYLCLVAAVAAGFRRLGLAFPETNEFSLFEHAIRLFVTISFILVSAVVGGYFVHRLAQVHVSRNWQNTTAVVLPPKRREVVPWEDPAGRGEIRFFRVRFEFEVDGTLHTSQLFTTRGYKAGDRVPLVFDPADPSRHCFNPGSDTLGVLWTIIFMLVFGSIGLALLFI